MPCGVPKAKWPMVRVNNPGAQDKCLFLWRRANKSSLISDRRKDKKYLPNTVTTTKAPKLDKFISQFSTNNIVRHTNIVWQRVWAPRGEWGSRKKLKIIFHKSLGKVNFMNPEDAKAISFLLTVDETFFSKISKWIHLFTSLSSLWYGCVLWRLDPVWKMAMKVLDNLYREE